MITLKYADLYQLTEELQQLQGAKLQGVFNPSPLRYALEVRAPGESRLIVVDLTPPQPFIVSTSYTKIKSQANKTPVLNFLKAHFVNLPIQKFEMAEKPNRTLKITFSAGEKKGELIFKCYPHGQHLILKSEGKVVNFPLRPKDPADSRVTFVEPAVVLSWEFNKTIEKSFLGESQSTETPQPYHEKLIKKLERALEALEKGLKDQRPTHLEKIKSLEMEAARLSSQKKSGVEIQNIFSEIKKIQKKEEVANQRKLDLGSQIEKLKKSEAFVPQPQKINLKKEKFNFSGTRVGISEKWELWVGRTAWQNDDLLREASSHDLWIHLRDYPGAHGVLRGPKKSEPTPSQVEFAACVVAILSQSKKKPFCENEKLDFIVTPKKFVKKRKGAAPGRVTVERETVRRIAFKIVKFEVI